MPRYMPTGNAPPTFPPGWNECDTPGAGSSAVAYDIPSKACYPIDGLGITIGPFGASFHGAMDVYNFNVSMNGDQAPAVNSVQLNTIGPILV